MGIISKLLGRKDKKIYMNLNEETIKNNEIIQAQQKKIVSQEAQLKKISAKEKENKEKEKNKNKQNEINKSLKEQKLDLEATRHGKVIKLSKFYYDMFVKNKNKPGGPYYIKRLKRYLEITDKNDEVILGKFGDFGIMSGGKLCVIDTDGEIQSAGNTLPQIIFKPESFENQIKRGHIKLPVDKNNNWIEDIDYVEFPEPLNYKFNEEGNIHIEWSKIKRKTVRDIIADKLTEINGLAQELEYAENVNVKIKNELDSVKRALRIFESQGDSAQTELSKSINNINQIGMRFGDVYSQNTKLLELKSTYENLLDRKDEVINNVLKKIELTGEPKLDRLKASLKDDLEFYKAILPDRVEIREEAQPLPIPMAQPGDIIKTDGGKK